MSCSRERRAPFGTHGRDGGDFRRGRGFPLGRALAVRLGTIQAAGRSIHPESIHADSRKRSYRSASNGARTLLGGRRWMRPERAGPRTALLEAALWQRHSVGNGEAAAAAVSPRAARRQTASSSSRASQRPQIIRTHSCRECVLPVAGGHRATAAAAAAGAKRLPARRCQEIVRASRGSVAYFQ